MKEASDGEEEEVGDQECRDAVGHQVGKTNLEEVLDLIKKVLLGTSLVLFELHEMTPFLQSTTLTDTFNPGRCHIRTLFVLGPSRFGCYGISSKDNSSKANSSKSHSQNGYLLKS